MQAWPFAAVICDAKGRLVTANAAAEQMDAAGMITLPSRGEALFSTVPAEATAIAAHIASVANGGAGGYLTISDPAGVPLLVAVSPLPRHFDLPAGLSLVIVRSSVERAFGVAQVRVLFGLSQTQAELAVALYDGATIESFAAQRGVKLSTLRTHLAQIFLRAGVGSQKDLIRLMGQIPPLRHEG